MAQLFKDIVSFLQSLSFIDYILYFAVLILILLVVALIYVMKMSEYEEVIDNGVESQNDEIDLRKIVSTIEENPTPVIDMTAYEAEQEEKAIISYDELIKTAKHSPLCYDEEEIVDNEVKVKKINLDQLANPKVPEEVPQVEVKLFHYEREEAFLETLKQLNQLLN